MGIAAVQLDTRSRARLPGGMDKIELGPNGERYFAVFEIMKDDMKGIVTIQAGVAVLLNRDGIKIPIGLVKWPVETPCLAA